MAVCTQERAWLGWPTCGGLGHGFMTGLGSSLGRWEGGEEGGRRVTLQQVLPEEKGELLNTPEEACVAFQEDGAAAGRVLFPNEEEKQQGGRGISRSS